ncbi:polycystin 1L2, partial [Paragonimus westermani]
ALAKVIPVIANMTSKDVLSLTLLSSTIDFALSNMKYIDQASQESLISATDLITSRLESLVKGTDSETRQVVTDGLTRVVLDMVQMTNIQISDPIPKDVPNDPTILDYNVDLEKDGTVSVSVYDESEEFFIEASGDSFFVILLKRCRRLHDDTRNQLSLCIPTRWFFSSDVVNTIDPDNSKYPYTFFLNKTQLTTARAEALSKLGNNKLNQTVKSKFYIGYRQLNENELDQYTTSKRPPVPYPYRDQINNTAKSRIFLSSCLSTNGSNPTSWLLDECEVGSATTSRQTECLCRRPTTVTAGWQVLPNKLDFAYIFANMDFEKNGTVYGTEIAIGVLFLLLFLWARRADLRDIEQLGVTPLAENDPMDEYLYEVIVNTGRRPNAGTQSKINIILSGEFADTEAKILQDPYRPVLQRGQINRFLLTCQGSLGPLLYCRLWHDNSVDLGGASWYCNHITVVDLQTRERVYCIVQRWFAVDEDDGLIDRLIPVSSDQEMNKLNRSFSENLSRGLSDEHLWLSVVSRPVTSRFTRVERVACCLTLLFLTMLTSGMFYRGEGAVKQPDLLSIGPFALSSSEVTYCLIQYHA